jgi:hypothetical protein
MALPTAAEELIYKSQVKTFAARVQVTTTPLDFDGSWSDNFEDASINQDKWQTFVPEGWGEVVESGGKLRVSANTEEDESGEIEGQPFPPWVISKVSDTEGSPFPTLQTDFTHTAVIQFPVITGFGVQYRVFASDIIIFEVEANLFNGLNIKMNEQIVTTYGQDVGQHTYVLSYDSTAQQYTATRDAVPIPGAVLNTSKLPTSIVIGNSAVNQGIKDVWTDIEVYDVSTTGTADAPGTPAWVAFSSGEFVEDSRSWAFLPTVLTGDYNIDRNNDVDTLTLTVHNRFNDTNGIYSDFVFHNKLVKVSSRMGDTDGNWTDWRTTFSGRIDDPRGEVGEGRSTFTITARDRWRRDLFKRIVVKSYADLPAVLAGATNGLNFRLIIRDLFREALIPDTAHSVTIANQSEIKPKTFNVVDRSAGDAVVEILEGMIYTWYVDHAADIVYMEEWPTDNSTADYTMQENQDVDRVVRIKDAFNVIAQSFLSVQHTEDAVDIALAWPPAPVPAGGTISRFASKVGNNFSDLEDNDLPLKRWKFENRSIGQLVIDCTGQDWMEYGTRLAVREQNFLDIQTSKIYVLDGWRVQWDSRTHRSTLRAVDIEFVDIIRDGLVG